jgi:hypothetical protein
MSLYDDCLDILRRRQIAFVDEFVPFYLCSVGCHIFNLVNMKKQLFWEHGRIPNLRLHMMMIAPPGYFKSFLLRQLLDGPSSLFGNSQLDPHFESTMTEAAFSGTIRFGENGTPVETEGAAKEYANSILGCEEFSAITQMMDVGYAIGLDVALLQALDSGSVRKRLAAGKMHYQTNLTLWAASQPMRFDLTGGMGRRLFFCQFIPSQADQTILTNARRAGKDVRNIAATTAEITIKVKELFQKVELLDEIHFDQQLYKLFDKLHIPHFEEILYEKLALGYTIIRKEFAKQLYVVLDEEVERLIRKGFSWRQQLKRGARQSQIVVVLKDNGGHMSVPNLKRQLLDFGLTWTDATVLISELQRERVIAMKENELYLVS